MKKLSYVFVLMMVLIVSGGLGFFIIDIYLLPKLINSPYFGKSPLVQRAGEKTTIINKTEQVVIREDDSVEKVASQSATATVSIISVAKNSVQEGASSVPSATAKPLRKVAPASTKEVARPFELKQVLNGAGVLVTNDGFIVTYRDAIYEKDADYTVTLFNGQNYPAQLIGIDNFTNLAYLKIDTQNVPAISFANSDDMRAGKKLIVLSNADEDYKSRFSSALLSNVNKTFNLSGKTVASSEKLEGVFEVDFLNQEKYVGGPVINFNGEMVGVVGFVEIDGKKQYLVIPSNVIKSSLEMAIRGALNDRPVFGLYYQPLTKEIDLAQKFGYQSGALVFSQSGKASLAVIAGSPAESAGLQVGDIIVSINDKNIDLSNTLSSMVSSMKKGDDMRIIFIRNGEKKEVTVKL